MRRPKMKTMLEKRGSVASRRRISRIMRENNPVSAYSGRKHRPAGPKPNEAPQPNPLDGRFGGHPPRTRIVGDLAYVRIGRKWSYACPPVDPCNREIVGHSVGDRRDSGPAKAAFATVGFPCPTSRCSTRTAEASSPTPRSTRCRAFGIERSLSKKGRPHDNAVVKSANNSLKRGLVHRESFPDTEHLKQRVNEWVWFCNNTRIHSTLGCMSPVEFREAGLFV